MADKWMDERDRRWRERDRQSEDFGGGQRRFEGGEGRSFDQDQVQYGARRSGPDRDRVFGERETGMSYGGEAPRSSGGGIRNPGGQGPGRGWQDRDYAGVSPAMRNHEYDAERQSERYQSAQSRGGGERGGRFYGDAGRERVYREEYGQGGVEYGAVPRGYDAGRSSRMASGGTGGYDYERGYGDGGRRQGGGEDRGERFERAGHDAGDFVRRAGERVASWFGGEGEGDEARARRERDFRGMGPKGYKRADERISDEAHERLTDDPWLDATHVAVSVSGGEITLSGTVVSREAKHRAERCVEDISGVNHVQNNLRLDRGGPLTRADSGFGDSVLEHQMRGETGSGDKIPGGSISSNGSDGKPADTGKSR